MKGYEAQCTSIQLDNTLPVVCRLDGSLFSKFTKDMEKPYDVNFNKIMSEVTLYAMKLTNANIAYTQSDEISLIWENKEESQSYYNGKIYKILSILSSKVSVRFNKLLPKYLPNKVDLEPVFDCRV